MPDPLVLCNIDERVSIVALTNRPEKLDAISVEGRSFCAGYDISAKAPAGHDWRSNPTGRMSICACSCISGL